MLGVIVDVQLEEFGSGGGPSSIHCAFDFGVVHSILFDGGACRNPLLKTAERAGKQLFKIFERFHAHARSSVLRIMGRVVVDFDFLQVIEDRMREVDFPLIVHLIVAVQALGVDNDVPAQADNVQFKILGATCIPSSACSVLNIPRGQGFKRCLVLVFKFLDSHNFKILNFGADAVGEVLFHSSAETFRTGTFIRIFDMRGPVASLVFAIGGIVWAFMGKHIGHFGFPRFGLATEIIHNPFGNRRDGRFTLRGIASNALAANAGEKDPPSVAVKDYIVFRPRIAF